MLGGKLQVTGDASTCSIRSDDLIYMHDIVAIS